MSKIIHVLNGDSAVELFNKSGLEGEIVVWRELLCEGPLHTHFASDEFWAKRYAFFKEELGVEKLDYYDKSIKEILKIEDVSGYSEVVLWFEYDLFCQVNLLAACSYLLANFSEETALSLVCVGKVNGKEGLQSLTDFTAEEFVVLYRNKLNLSKGNLMFADECWKLYVENDVEKLKNFFFRKPKFEYLQLAINQHLKRIPAEDGLNEIDTKILQIISANSYSEKDIIKALLIWQKEETVYGFADLQYVKHLKKLQNYYTVVNDCYELNIKGNEFIK